MQDLIKVIKEDPKYDAISWALDDDITIDAICLLLPKDTKFLGFIISEDDAQILEIQEDIDFEGIERTPQARDYSAGIKIELATDNNWFIGDIIPRLKNLNYCFGRYYKEADKEENEHWSLDIDVLEDPENPRIFYISFYSDDSTY